MLFTFDTAKDTVNREKHGLPLAFGRQVLADAVATLRDDRQPYGEERLIALGWVGEHFYACVYTVRADTTRIISVRRANRKERERYGGD